LSLNINIHETTVANII